MIEPTDLTALALPGHPSLAPDGRRIVVSVETVDPDDLSYRHRLWMLTQDLPAEPITATGDWSDTAPTFSPNGDSIAYLSTRDGRRAVHLVEPASGKVTVLDGPDAPVTDVHWFDDTRLIALVERPPATAKADPVRVSWLQYKSDGRAEFLEPTSELWLLTCDGTAQPLLAPTGRIGELTTHGSSIHYSLSARHADELTPATEVRTFDIDTGSDTLRWRCPSLVKALAATSATGKLLAVANAAPGQSVTPPQVWVVNSPADGDGAEPAFVTGLECERALVGDSRPKGGGSIIHPVEGSDEVLLLATVGMDVAVHLGVPGQDAEPRRLTPPGQSVTDFAAARGGQLAVCLESPTAPTEVYGGPIGEALGKRSEFSAGWTTHELIAPETVQVKAADGELIDALLYKAAGESAAGERAPGPLLLRIHGGPHLAFGTTFDFETQLQVAAGYHVLLPNLRGSAGKGIHFRSLSVGQWGIGDYSDLNCVLDWAVDTGIADDRRLFLAGGSYGGYMVNWTLTRSERFRAAVSERSVSNLLSKLGTSDNGPTTSRFEMGGADLFGDDALQLLKRSPLHYADQIVTPVLLVHGEADYRCPIEQSEQLFVALRRLGKEVEFLRFPGASHTFASSGQPDHRIARLHAILQWFAAHGGPELK